MVVQELNDSKDITITDDSVSIVLHYSLCIEDDYVDEATDHQVVLDLIYAYFPFVSSVDLDGTTVPLVLSETKPVYVSQYVWKVKLTYSLPENESSDTNFIQLGFSTSGGTKTITQSKFVRSAVKAGVDGDPAPDLGGAIGYTKNGIQGTEVQTKGFSFTLTVYFPPTTMDLTYLNTLYVLSPSYNNAPFKGFAAGEVLFLHAQGSGSQYKLIPVTFEFIASPNISALADPGFVPLTALGHDVVDYLYYEGIDPTTNDLIMLPSYRYVHQVYDAANFALLGIGT